MILSTFCPIFKIKIHFLSIFIWNLTGCCKTLMATCSVILRCFLLFESVQQTLKEKNMKTLIIWFCTLSPQKANIFLQLFFELMVMTVTSYMNEFRFRSTVIWIKIMNFFAKRKTGFPLKYVTSRRNIPQKMRCCLSSAAISYTLM